MLKIRAKRTILGALAGDAANESRYTTCASEHEHATKSDRNTNLLNGQSVAAAAVGQTVAVVAHALQQNEEFSFANEVLRKLQN